MGLLYLKEHTSCYNYTKCIREGFLYYKFQQREIHQERNEADCILFVMEGDLEISCNGEKLKLSAGNMICFSRGSICNIHSPGQGSIVIAQFDNAVQSCEKVSFSQLYALNVRNEKEMCPLEIRPGLQLFLELLISYLKDGAGCIHFHEVKLKELFWNIRFYYTKTEQAVFFHPILGNDYEFKKVVLNNYRNARTVKELARLCGSSLSSFKRKFLREFKEPASEWLQKQINRMIKHKLADEDIPIGDIADDLHFSSQSQFCRYCKRHFGYTPGEWRKSLKDRSKTPNVLSQKSTIGRKRQKKELD
ncbi:MULTISPECIES: AraC family transcriptional regulator [Bacteroides]|uniref:AraC family transcriptional regulator n=1 Tax=Bacteroides TaxID=816 RepID=UPI001CAA51F8|nr:AraC family transcriptional regulator [Bacteroides fragilis]MBY2902143.1 transcriptional regulator [Bacteroides fragilis]